MALLLFVSIICLHSLLVVKGHSSSSPLAPALYVFGDSFSDSGNNNFFQTRARENYKPYGIDFPDGATGRFTNGKTFVDFIAAPTICASIFGSFNRREIQYYNRTELRIWISWHSESGTTTVGDNLSLDERIDYFKDTKRIYLRRVYKNPVQITKYLSESIFVIFIGSNDYINNYLQPDNYNSSQIYTPEQFADLLLYRLTLRMYKGRNNTLYQLGARKLVVFNIFRVGCIPAVVDTASPRPTTPCVEDVNNLVLLYNTKLPKVITNLERILLGSTFIHGDAYNMSRNSSEVGFTAAQTPFCEVDGNAGSCVRDSVNVPCEDRTQFIFWDSFDPTKVVNNAMAKDCFSGSSSCVPINIQQLAKKR
ncbi:GDSL esterase/lipase [Thalictrum thalictroides]|uniref:GDSL esterase/lipase n=1 Tax=Thalictrum thalictroides TaxID=46969 RepID=A0A7J6X9B4_THATH|nr:GDSL esterase/lipase [Thalictrum thalictroides]